MRYLTRGILGLVAVAVFLSPVVFGQGSDTKAAKAEVGKAAPDFALKCPWGKEHKLSDYKGKSVVVLTWWSYKCPWSRATDPYFNTLAKEYKDKGVAILAIDSNTPAG